MSAPATIDNKLSDILCMLIRRLGTESDGERMATICAIERKLDAVGLSFHDLADMIEFRVETRLLPRGAFAAYTAQRQAEGADLAHLKPPHLNPSKTVLTLLTGTPERAGSMPETETDSVAVH